MAWDACHFAGATRLQVADPMGSSAAPASSWLRPPQTVKRRVWSPREELREDVRVAPGRAVRVREDLRLASRSGNAEEAGHEGRHEHDRVVLGPGPAERLVGRVGDGGRRAARNGRGQELPPGEEADSLPARGEERLLGAFALGDDARLEAVERSQVEPRHAGGIPRDVGDRTAVARDRGPGVAGENLAGGQRNREPGHPRGGGGAQTRPAPGPRGGRRGRNERDRCPRCGRSPPGGRGRGRQRGRCGGGRVRESDPSLADVAQALLGVALEAAPQQFSDGLGRACRKCGPFGVRLEHRRERVAHRLALEEPATGEHLVEKGTERPDVGALVHDPASGLLGRHVGRGAEDEPGGRAGVGERRRLRQVGGGRDSPTLAAPRLGQAEVEDLDLPVRRHLHVRGLEVAVDDALLVRLLEGLGDLLRDGDRLVDRNRPALQALGEVFALDELHGEEVGRGPVARGARSRSRRGGRCRGG